MFLSTIKDLSYSLSLNHSLSVVMGRKGGSACICTPSPGADCRLLDNTRIQFLIF